MKTNEGEAEKMSAQKRRNTLIGFAAVAIVLAVAVAVYVPTFNEREADASGAIGAVEKHRAPQITESDVVLGDEQTKKEQQIVYADFLADAAALQNFAADLASDSQVEVVSRLIAARSTDVNARYRAAAADFLEAMRQLGAEDQLGRAAFASLQARVAANLAVRDMQALSAEFSGLVDQLGVSKRRAVENFAADLASADDQSLGRMARAEQLQAAFDADALGARIRARAAYVDAMANEAMTLDAIARALRAKSLDARALGRISRDLVQAADQLEARARGNIETMMANDAALLEAVNRMQSRSLQAARRADLASFEQALGVQNRALAAKGKHFQEGSLVAVNAHLENREQLGRHAHLASIMSESNLAGFSRQQAAKAR